jgi:hypothetical protein
MSTGPAFFGLPGFQENPYNVAFPDIRLLAKKPLAIVI